jgi:hypothetical protein
MSSPVSGDLLSAASLLATVLSLLYSTWYGEIRDARNTTIPLHDRNRVIKSVRAALWSRAVPVLAGAALLTAALTPPSVEIVQSTSHTWVSASGSYHYDPVQACFLGVFVVTIMLILLTASATWSLSSLLHRLRQPLENPADHGSYQAQSGKSGS